MTDVDRELDTLIKHRSRRRDEQDALEAMWTQSERRYQERGHRENRAAWYAFHEKMRKLHESLAAEHEARALSLLEDG
ncbi:MAG: hypothetical protein IN808_02910 [Rubrobacter sp.]|nr:hypothetical protein [Rubrobacter sp.]